MTLLDVPDVSKHFCEDLSVARLSTTGPLEAWQEVARHVRDRRLALNLSNTEINGVSASTVSNLENVKQTTYETRRLILLCQALGWTTDSIARILRGDGPELANAHADGRGVVIHSLNGKLNQLSADDLADVEAFVNGKLAGE